MSRGLLALAAVLVTASALAQDPSEAVLGRWAGDSSIIEVARSAEGGLAATVIALKNPLFREGEGGPVGQPVTDRNNPDPARRDQPVLGLNLLAGYRWTGERWQGEIYDPESGKTYSSRMSVDRKGDLKMRGYIGTPLLGRTARFEPVSRCSDLTVRMLASAGLPDCAPD
ncbi:MAG: DUF2147 domain-containing protein [Pseudomonadota bacterium]